MIYATIIPISAVCIMTDIVTYLLQIQGYYLTLLSVTENYSDYQVHCVGIIISYACPGARPASTFGGVFIPGTFIHSSNKKIVLQRELQCNPIIYRSIPQGYYAHIHTCKYTYIKIQGCQSNPIEIFDSFAEFCYRLAYPKFSTILF